MQNYCVTIQLHLLFVSLIVCAPLHRLSDFDDGDVLVEVVGVDVGADAYRRLVTRPLSRFEDVPVRLDAVEVFAAQS